MKFRWFITKKMLVGLIGLLVAAILLILLNGCSSTSERSLSSSQRTRITERHPTPDGGYAEKTTEYTTSEQDKLIRTEADANWAGALSKGIGQAATGDWLGLAITGVTTMAAGGAAVMKHREATAHKKDADEAWDKLIAEKDKLNG